MKLSIFTTLTSPTERGDCWRPALECYSELADELVVVNGGLSALPTGIEFKEVESIWPKEFDWKFIGEQFQKGYDACTGDWVIHMDIDWLFHEKDFENIKNTLFNSASPGISFLKWQFIQPQSYNVKSRLIVALNKNKFDGIKFNSGGDLCQPSLNGEEMSTLFVPQSRIPLYNYECILKTKKQLLDDKGRMARAWQKEFGEYKLGGPDDQTAYDKWLEMVVGRYRKPQATLRLEKHPKYIQDTIKSLKQGMWGFDAFGALNA